MKDLNLFNNYKKRKDFSTVSYSRVVLPVCVLTLFVIFGGIFIFTNLIVHHLKADISSMQKILTSAESAKKLEIYTETKNQVEVMKNYVVVADSIESTMSKTGFLTSGFLVKLNSAIPISSYIESMKITGTDIEIVGVSKSRTEVAEYQYNLKKLGLFDDVFIGNISIMKNKNNQKSNLVQSYEFALKCVMKGANEYATK